MDRKKQIVSIGLILLSAIFIYLFFIIFNSALRFEDNKTGPKNPSVMELEKTVRQKSALNMEGRSWFKGTFIYSPLEVESLLRSELRQLNKPESKHMSTLRTAYLGLLSKKPTWPYFHSGLVQLSSLNQVLDLKETQLAVKFGHYERKVLASLAEVLFYRWNMIEEADRNNLLGYLSDQTVGQIAQVVKISAKFARIYEYCDFLYEKKHVEYAACKRQYWQPLLDK